MVANFVYLTASQEWRSDVNPEDYRDGWAHAFSSICLTRLFQEDPNVLHGDWKDKALRKRMRGGRIDVSSVESDPRTIFFQGDTEKFKKGLVRLFSDAGGRVGLYQALIPQHDDFHSAYVQERFPGATKMELTMTVSGSMWKLLRDQNLA